MTSPTINVASSVRVYQTFSYAPVIMLSGVLLVATLSFRDFFFMLVGIAVLLVVFVIVQKERLEKKNAKSRLLITFEDIKKDFKPLMEKVESSYAKDNFFVNNYSKGVYHHITFEEQVDFINWVEVVEKKLLAESAKQFDEFEKSLTDLNELGVSRTFSKHEGMNDESTIQPGLTAEVSLRDTSKELSLIDSITLKQVDENYLKDTFTEIKNVLGDFYRCNEESYSLWGELNNQTMDKIYKYFSSKDDKSPQNLAMFSLSILDMFQSSVSLISKNDALKKFLENKIALREAEEKLFGYDWDTLRVKITEDNPSLISRNSKENKESMEAYSQLHKEAFESLEKTASNIRELKEYFATTKRQLTEIQREFSQRMNDVKFKIAAFKQNVEKCEDYELQLKLEYEIRLEINRLYQLKHSHESECVGLDRRLEELEAFNTSTDLVHSLLNYQIIQFFEKCEDNMLVQLKEASLNRLANILSCSQNQLQTELGEESVKQIEEFYGIKLETPISDDQFKEFLISNLLNGRLILQENFEEEKQVTWSFEMLELSSIIADLKAKVTSSKVKLESFELDQQNEFEEAILIKKVPGIHKMNVKRDDHSQDDSIIKLNFDTTAAKDWTNNQPKAKQLIDSVEKMSKTLDQILKICQANLKTITTNEAKINKHLLKQEHQTIKVYLFRRLIRVYFGERICLEDLIQKLMALIDLLNFLKQDLGWLKKTFFDDENIDKLISVNTKMDIFSFLQEVKSVEVNTKAFTMHCICSQLFKEYEIVQILSKDKYPDFHTTASMEDLHSWQRTIRKGSKRMVVEEETLQHPKSPQRTPSSKKLTIQVEERNSSPRRDSDSREYQGGNSASPVKSSKQYNVITSISQPFQHLPKFLKLESFNQLLITLFQEWCTNSFFEVFQV